ncbi:cation transporter [Edaphobacter flagellatus]|uniref:cation transporter n=1 Tax=Edaphobacter flagellatus TaxID=1933044 RepID=UPI0036F30EC4
MSSVDRVLVARRGRQLELLTILWGTCEAGVAIVAAIRGHSISLTGFGIDSVIEVVSASVLMWRMSQELDSRKRHHAEYVSQCVAGTCLVLLGVYILMESLWSLAHHSSSQPTKLGIAVTSAALVGMPMLARAKKRVGRTLNSNAMMSDARQTDFCSYQAAIVLLGLSVQAVFGWAWADSIAGLFLVPIILHAAILSFQGKNCCNH